MSRVLVVEGWPRGSHRQWVRGWTAHSAHRIGTVTWPDLRWSRAWRTSALGLAPAVAHAVERDQPDCVVVSGPVDTASLRGLVGLGTCSVVRMQHETELLYPTSVTARTECSVASDVRAMVAADGVWFASRWHRDRSLSAIRDWLSDSVTDGAGGASCSRLPPSHVLPIGLDVGTVRPRKNPRPVVLWPHRWEHDKDPEAFARVARRIGADAQFVLAGDGPTVDDGRDLRSDLAADLGPGTIVGPLDRSSYQWWLERADVVVSCAHHDFYGLGVAEAVAHGALPVVPLELAYSEVLGQWPTMYRRGGFGTALADTLANLDAIRHDCRHRFAGAQNRAWPVVVSQWDDAVSDAVSTHLSPTGQGA